MSDQRVVPWLENLFSSPNLEIDTTRSRIGRAVQLIRIQNDAETHPELKYPVTCEISDREHYMQAVLTKNSVKRLEKASSRHIESLCGALVTINHCVPKVFVPGVTHSKSVPRNVTSSHKPVFWMVITKVRYVGGAGNGIDGELRHISSSAYVRQRLGEFVEEVTSSVNNSTAQQQQREEDRIDHGQEAVDDHISDGGNGGAIESEEGNQTTSGIIEPEEVEMSEPVPKRQRVDTEDDEGLPSIDMNDLMDVSDLYLPDLDAYQSEGQNEEQNEGRNAGQNQNQDIHQARSSAQPIISDQPIRFTAEAAWECQEMWYALSVQLVCLPFMRMSIPGQQHITSNCAASDNARQPAVAAAAYVRSNDHCMPRSTLAETSDNRGGSSIANTVTAGPRVHQPLPETIISRPAPLMTQGSSELESLMRPEGHGCIDSSTAMDRLFGAIASSPPCSTNDDALDGGTTEHIEYNLDSAMHWNQPDRITLREVPAAGESGQRT
ncbi:hypothetical protein GGI15_000963 [Coemansia interrupta]|uniref:Uncharacterized protein n=1 Tax=Coemansia interrupta TaxID=1126814 RepID=A0A9W8HKD3_9FUNG|nr:hypothetical protein GGI15_000963 [Coemansia interrupta]